MSEVQSRPAVPRGRGSGRGGRGGYSTRGSRGGHRPAKSDKAEDATATEEEEGELGSLKKQYASELSTIKEMFPDWTSDDIVFALHEHDGDLEGTIEKISQGLLVSMDLGSLLMCRVPGSVPQWGEVKKKTKDRAKPSTKEAVLGSNDASAGQARSGRRGRGADGRGGRGRTSERGRGAARAAQSTAVSNGSRARVIENAPSEPIAYADAPGALDDTAREAPAAENEREHIARDSNSPETSWEVVTPIEATSAPEAQAASLRPDGTRSWASMLKPKVIPQQAKSAPKTAMAHAAEADAQRKSHEGGATTEGLPPPMPTEGRQIEAVTSESAISESPAVQITPSQDELTKSNLDQVPDTSGPPPSITAASTAASTVDGRSTLTNATPVQMSHASGAMRPGLGGFATSAFKATSSVRSASFQRRFAEQQEAVVMPGKHAVDRAAVQFGSMGLNGTENADVEDEREEVETRAQPPQQSPVAPRASLPPPATTEAQVAPRQAPGLPPAVSQNIPHHAGATVASESLSHEHAYGYGQANRFTSHHDPPSAPKSFEAFGQQTQSANAPHQFENYGGQSQAPAPPAQPSHSHAGAFSSASTEYPSYYTSDNQRNAYQNYHNTFGHAPHAAQHDSAALQQKAGHGAGTGLDHAALPAANHAAGQSRYVAHSDAHSGHSTPNPPAPQSQTHAPPNQAHAPPAHAHGPPAQAHGQQIAPQAAGGFPYGHPSYYNGSPYYSQYMNQYGYGGSQGYGNAPYAAKYGQPHQGYGMSPHSSYEQTGSSAANVGGFGQQSSASRDTTGIGPYGRSGSAQPSDGSQHVGTPGGFGAMQDVFSRAQGGYQGHNAQSNAQNLGEDSARYSEPLKASGGPSPVPGPGGRPGSAANNQQAQTVPTGPGQPNYGAYPQMHGQQYGSSLGGSGQQSNAQNHQGPGYGGAYGSGFGTNYNYGNNSRGAWGANYGH